MKILLLQFEKIKIEKLQSDPARRRRLKMNSLLAVLTDLLKKTINLSWTTRLYVLRTLSLKGNSITLKICLQRRISTLMRAILPYSQAQLTHRVNLVVLIMPIQFYKTVKQLINLTRQHLKYPLFLNEM